MTREAQEPTPERRRTTAARKAKGGVRCGFPGCKSKGATPSGSWEASGKSSEQGYGLRCRKHQRLTEARDLLGAADRVAPSARKQESRSSKRHRRELQGKARGLPLDYEIGKLDREFRRATELRGKDPTTTVRICERILEQAENLRKPPKWFRKRIADFRELRDKAQAKVRKASTTPAPAARKTARPGAGQVSSTRNRARAELGLQEQREFEKRHRLAKGLATRDPEQAISICDSTLQQLEGRRGTKTLRDLFLRARTEALIHHRRKRR